MSRRIVSAAAILAVALSSLGLPGRPPATQPTTARAEPVPRAELLAELKLDKAHIARYSPRPQTVSMRKMEDDTPPDEKERRRKRPRPRALKNSILRAKKKRAEIKRSRRKPRLDD